MRAKAFSMVELIISMAIITIVITFLYTFLDANQRRHRSMQLLAVTTQGGRSAFEVLAQDLNQAGFNPPFNNNRVVTSDVTPAGSATVNVTLSAPSGVTISPVTRRIFYGSRLAVGGGCVPTASANIVDPPGGAAPLSATIAGTSTATVNPPNSVSIPAFAQANILATSSINIVASATFSGSATNCTGSPCPGNGAGGNTIHVSGALPVLTPGETVQATVSGFASAHSCTRLNGTYISTVLPSPTPTSSTFAFDIPASSGVSYNCDGGTVSSGTASGAGVTLPNIAMIVTTAAHGFLANQQVQFASVTTPSPGLSGIYTVTYPGTGCPSGSTTCFTISSGSLPASNTIYSTSGSSTATAGGAGRVSNSVTIVTSAPHGFTTGQSVTVGPPLTSVSDPSFNTASAIVASTPALNTFTYSQTAANAVSGNGQAGTFGATRNAAGNVTIITSAPHGFSAGQSITVVGVTSSLGTNFNGTFTIASVTPTSFTYTQTGLGADTGGNGTASGGGGALRSSGVTTITSTAAHGFTAGQTVVISGVSIGNFNGTFSIVTVPTSTTFTYLQTGLPDQASGNGSAQAGGASRDATGKVEIVTIAPHGFLVGEQVNIAGVTDSTFNMGGGTTAAITSVPNATTFTYTSGTATVASSDSGTAQVGGASRTSNTDYFVTTTPHGFSAGQTVMVSSVSNGSFNGSFVVKTILNPNAFTVVDNGGDAGSGGGNAAICNFDMQEIVVNNDPTYGTAAITATTIPVVLTSGLKAGTPVYSRNYPFASGIIYNNETPGSGLGIADNKLLFYGDILNSGDLYYGEYRLRCPGTTAGTFIDACATGCTAPPFTLTRFLTKLADPSTGVFVIPASKATALDGAVEAPLVTNIQGTCAVPTGGGGATGTTTLGTGNGVTTAFSGSITPTPLTPGTVTVQVGSPASVVGKDDALGNISGAGITGTVNYSSGAVSVTLTTPPALGAGVIASASINWLVYTAPDETSPSGTTGVTAAFDYTTSTYVKPVLNPDGTPVIWFKVDCYGAIDNSVTPPVPYFQTFVVDVRVALTLQESQIDPETRTFRIQRLRTHIVPRNINDALAIAVNGGATNLPGTPYDPTTTLCATGCGLPLP